MRTRVELPPAVREALAKYIEIRHEHGMCALWSCPRLAEHGEKLCTEHADYYADRRRRARGRSLLIGHVSRRTA
jgi:hypothetical protein